ASRRRGGGHGQAGQGQVLHVAQARQAGHGHHIGGERPQDQTGRAGALEQRGHGGRGQAHGGGDRDHHRGDDGVAAGQGAQGAADQGGRHHDAQAHAHRIGQADALDDGAHQLFGRARAGGHFAHARAQHDDQADHRDERTQRFGQQLAHGNRGGAGHYGAQHDGAYGRQHDVHAQQGDDGEHHHRRQAPQGGLAGQVEVGIESYG